ncbi:MAG TPA: ATP-grasp domain-containing protein, partial [Gammaproteobacteria bacterium]
AFAVEMFVTADEELLINEISPRVHNSGHVTLDACNVSQFEQHVRAVMGLPLLAVEYRSPAVMLNILYTEAIRQRCPPEPVTDRETHPGAALYWYGKAPGTKGRKMGHINALGDSVTEAHALADRALKKLSSGDSEQAA